MPKPPVSEFQTAPSDLSNEHATFIYQDSLDKMNVAYRENSFETFARYMRLPHHTSTFEENHTIADVEDLRRVFVQIQKHLHQSGVQDIVRYCTGAQFKTPTYIVGCHESRIVTPNALMVEAYHGLTHLELTSEGWQFVISQYAASDRSIPGIVVAGLETTTQGTQSL